MIRALIDFRRYVLLAWWHMIVFVHLLIIILRALEFTFDIMLLILHDCVSKGCILNRLWIDISLLESWVLWSLPVLFWFLLFFLIDVRFDWRVDGVWDMRRIADLIFYLRTTAWLNMRYRVLLLLRSWRLYCFLYDYRVIIWHLLPILSLCHLFGLFDFFTVNHYIWRLSVLVGGHKRLFLQKDIGERVSLISGCILLVGLLFLWSEWIVWNRS